MSTKLLLPSGAAPSNLHLRSSINAHGFIEGDLFDIAQRVRGVDPSLHVIQMEEGADCAYAIMEHGRDGIERLVFKVDTLDARVIDRLRFIMSVPLHERIDKLEADEYRMEEERKEAELEDLYERVGRPMLTELDRCDFIHSRPVSYPKLGVAAPGRAR